MPNEISHIKAEETTLLLGLAGLVVAPFYWVNTKFGISASILAIGAAAYGLNELGKEGRPGSNAVHNASTFFSPDTGASLDNTARNIVHGGDVVFKRLTGSSSS